MEDWQKQRLDFYQNSGALEFIKNYFDVKKGIRLVSVHNKDGIVKRNIDDYPNLKTRPLTLPDAINGKYTVLKENYVVHNLMYTFEIPEWINIINHTITLENSRVGMNPVIDLDTPDDPESDKANRLTFFDHIEQFNDKINIISRKIEDAGRDYNIMFSGNGIYFIIEGYYGIKLINYRNNFLNTLVELKNEHDLGNTLKVHIDNKQAPWSAYTKIPFTFHRTKNRISMPLPKGEIDSEWLNEVSNTDNIMKDYTIIDEIIKKANWNKIW